MATDLDALQQQMTCLLGQVELQPKQNMAAPAAPPKPRFPYVDTRINFDIRDAAEEKLVANILQMGFEQLVELGQQLELAKNLNYPETSTHTFSVKVRAHYYQVVTLKSQGKLHPTPTFGDVVQGWVRGYLIGDEYAKRHGW